MLEMWKTVHDRFNEDRDLLLDLLRRPTGPLRDDVDVVVGDVWIGLDWQGVKRDDAPHEQEQSQRDDEKTVIQGEIDEATDRRRDRCLLRSRQ